MPRACGETPSAPSAFDPRFASASLGLKRANRRAKGMVPVHSGGQKSTTRVLRLSLAEAERTDDLPVSIEADALEVVEQAAALGHHAKEAATRVVVLHVGLEVFGQVADALGQQRDLNLGRARVVVVCA